MVNDYESDEGLQEIYDEMYRKEEDRPKDSFLGGLDNKTRFYLAIGAGILGFLILNESINVNTGVMILVGALIAILLLKGSDTSRSELTYLECMMRVNELLKFLQRHPIGDGHQIPKGDVKVQPIGRKQYYEGKPHKRSYGVEIFDDEIGIEKTYFVEVDVFTGDIITFRDAPQGVFGDETKDIKLMPNYEMMLRKKSEEFAGRKFMPPR